MAERKAVYVLQVQAIPPATPHLEECCLLQNMISCASTEGGRGCLKPIAVVMVTVALTCRAMLGSVWNSALCPPSGPTASRRDTPEHTLTEHFL